MKKIIFSSLFLLLSLSSLAKNTLIKCDVSEEFKNKEKNISVEFIISNLGQKNAELIQHPKSEVDDGLIFVSPKEVNGLYSNMVHLNGQGGDLRVSEDKIRLFGDGDGYTFVDLVLFKNQNYQKGYVRVYGSGDQMYQKINCTVQGIK